MSSEESRRVQQDRTSPQRSSSANGVVNASGPTTIGYPGWHIYYSPCSEAGETAAVVTSQPQNNNSRDSMQGDLSLLRLPQTWETHQFVPRSG